MKLSIVTVCYNPGPILAECLQSVATQEFREFEHWVIDGGSDDGTVELLKREEKRSDGQLNWISETDDGLYDALNKGLDCVTGDVVGFLHADDFLAHPRVLSEVVDCMQDQSLDACYADLVYVDAEDASVVKRNWRSEPFRVGMFLQGWMPPHPTFYARRAVYERLGGFDTQFRIGADWDLLLRFMEVHRIKTRYVPSVWVKMRVGGVSNRSLKNMWTNHRECLRRSRSMVSDQSLGLL